MCPTRLLFISILIRRWRNEAEKILRIHKMHVMKNKNINIFGIFFLQKYGLDNVRTLNRFNTLSIVI